MNRFKKICLIVTAALCLTALQAVAPIPMQIASSVSTEITNLAPNFAPAQSPIIALNMTGLDMTTSIIGPSTAKAAALAPLACDVAEKLGWASVGWNFLCVAMAALEGWDLNPEP